VETFDMLWPVVASPALAAFRPLMPTEKTFPDM
jgi:hypothetical protein